MWKEIEDRRSEGVLHGRRWTDGEHPEVVIGDIAAHPPATGHIITFANEKGGVGKSTLAFHCAVALAHAGHRVVAVDLDGRQATLERGLSFREGTAKILGVALPMPAHAVLHRPCAAQLAQELRRLDARADYIVLDAPGTDCRIFRRAVGMADTLVTPINASFVDLPVLGHVDPVSGRAGHSGGFAETVVALRAERERQGLRPIDWLVAKNRVRHCERRHIGRIDIALATLAEQKDFRIVQGLTERVAFRELFQFGLTHLDLAMIPGAARASAGTVAEVAALLGEFVQPVAQMRRRVAAVPQARTSARARAAFREALAAAI